MRSPPLTPSVILVLGGQGEQSLARTLASAPLPPSRVWCAVPDEIEASAAQGRATTLLLNPWPGRRVAMARLASNVQVMPGDRVQTLLAGTCPTRHPGRAHQRNVGLIIPAFRSWTFANVIGVRGHRNAVLSPGTGMVMRGDAFLRLLEAGWFSDAAMTVLQVKELAGRMKVVRRKTVIAEQLPELPRRESSRQMTCAVLIPAYNEAPFIGDTIRSVHAQSRPPSEIVVIDDGSSDGTGDTASRLGARVIRLEGTGSKGQAINGALPDIATDVILIVDADTRLHQDAVRHLMRDMEAGLDATHGAVFPSSERGIWASGRIIEYATSVRLTKPVQRSLGRVVVMSGCVLAISMDALSKAGGFQSRTMVEDLDLTWTLHEMGFKVGYTPRAVAYPIEPTNWRQYRDQIRRWSRGFFQAISVHARQVRGVPMLAFILACSLVDVVLTPIAMAGAITFWVTGASPDTPLIILAVWQFLWIATCIALAATLIGPRRAIRASPGFLVTTTLAPIMYLEAMLTEWVFKRRLKVWVKGH